MSTQQQAMIMETILSLRRSLKRTAYDSDSDSSIDHSTNRGNKLKKRARFVRQGRLTSSMGPEAYKEVAELAGYQRAIINRNPPLIDEDGYDIESDDDEEQVQEAVSAALEENPYSAIRLEQILAPLTAVTDLPSHPTFSQPFTSRALTELIHQGRNLMQKENAALWKAKPLLTKLVGDNTWAPCGLMTAPDGSDALLFSDTMSFLNRPTGRQPTGGALPAPTVNGHSKAAGSASTKQAQGEADGLYGQIATRRGGDAEQNRGETLPDAVTGPNGGASEEAAKHPKPNGTPSHGADKDKDGPATTQPDGAEDAEMAEAPSTTAAAHNNPPIIPPPDNSLAAPPTTDADDDEPFIHPLFRPPPAAHPDRDLGLPEQEAEEVRRLLLLYVQKQEEICRGTKRLYEGLLRADRYRGTVWRWAKAEAHCGANRDMSDGEDWYDKDEWGLEGELKKGEDEVEEETAAAQTQQKKTRNRK